MNHQTPEQLKQSIEDLRDQRNREPWAWTNRDRLDLLKRERALQLMADEAEENRTEGKITTNKKRVNPHE